jgi:hypothetical protein
MAEQKAKMAAQAGKPQKRGLMASMMERADDERKSRGADAAKTPVERKTSSSQAKPGSRRTSSGSRRKPSGSQRKPKKPGSGGKRGG